MTKSVIELNSSINMLPGIGEKKVKLFHKLGLMTMQDLLYYFPRDYEDWSERDYITEAVDSQWFTIEAVVAAVPSVHRKGKLTIIRAKLEQNVLLLSGLMPWIKDSIVGASYVFMGSQRKGNLGMAKPLYVSVKKADFA